MGKASSGLKDHQQTSALFKPERIARDEMQVSFELLELVTGQLKAYLLLQKHFVSPVDHCQASFPRQHQQWGFDLPGSWTTQAPQSRPLHLHWAAELPYMMSTVVSLASCQSMNIPGSDHENKCLLQNCLRIWGRVHFPFLLNSLFQTSRSNACRKMHLAVASPCMMYKSCSEGPHLRGGLCNASWSCITLETASTARRLDKQLGCCQLNGQLCLQIRAPVK